MTCEPARGDLELYVVGALPPDRVHDVEAHASGCDACAAELRSFSDVIVGLAGAVPRAAPSAGVRGRVLSAAVASPSGPSRIARLWWAGWAAAAALLIATVSLGAGAQRLRGELAETKRQLAAARIEAATNERRAAELQPAASRDAQAMAILTAPDLATVTLHGQPPTAGARAQAFWSRSRGLVFSASHLPSPRPGRTYQLWVVTAASAPVSVGVMRPDPNGHIAMVVATPPEMPAPVAMALTEEPAGGVPAPTGQKLLVGAPVL